MAKIQWSEGLAVGIADIDREHHETIDRLNALADAIDDETFTRRFFEFADHLREHFANEQTLMEDNGYFAQTPHMEEHRRILGMIDNMLKQADIGDLDGARFYMESEFPEWFLAHGATMDKMTADFLNSIADENKPA